MESGNSYSSYLRRRKRRVVKIDSYKPEKYADLVERIWILESPETDSEIIVPPDQYINLIIPLNGSSWMHNETLISTSLLEGISLQSSLTRYPVGTKLVGIRFYPFGHISFFNISGKELINKVVPVEDRVIAESKFDFDGCEKKILVAVEGYLEKHFNPKNYNQTSLLRKFYQYFRWEHQAASIEEFCEEFGTNYTSLNRKFSKVIGLSAKRFERLIKFRKALCDLTDKDESFTNIGLDAGYFDQSHFIREFKLFMNYSPKTYNALIRQADKDTKIINYNFSLY